MTSHRSRVAEPGVGGADVAALEAELGRNPEFRRLWQATAAKRAIAIALVRMRKQAGRTQADVARRAGWNKAFVSRLEGATGAMPDTATLVRYSAACDRALGLVFASIGGGQAHVIDAVTLAAPRAAKRHPFERLRGDDLALADEAVAAGGDPRLVR